MSEQVVYPKHPLLRQVVDFFWTLEGTPSSEDDTTLIYPENCMEILLSFSGSTRWLNDGHQLQLTGSIFSPIRTCPYDIHPLGHVEYLAIRFLPHTLPLIQDSVDGLANRACSLDEVLDRRLWHMIQPVFSMETMPERIQYLEDALTRWIMKGIPQQSAPLKHALTLMHHTHGSLPIQDICEESGFYPRKLERQFQHFLGVTPKMYARILRFNHVMNSFSKAVRPAVSDIVFQAGYADQAHFIRECREFTGRTPGELFL